MSRTKIIKTGFIDTSKFCSKKDHGAVPEEFHKLWNECSPIDKDVPKSDKLSITPKVLARTSAAKKHAKNLAKKKESSDRFSDGEDTSEDTKVSDNKTSVEELTQYSPYINEYGYYIWSSKHSKPDCLDILATEVKALFNIGNIVDGSFICTLVPPTLKGESDVFIPKANTDVASRIVCNVGKKMETFDIEASAAGNDGSGKILIGPREAIIFPIGICNGIDITSANKNFDTIPPKRGFRQIKIKKSPSERFFICIDFLVNVNVVMKEFADKKSDYNPSTGKDIDSVLAGINTIGDRDKGDSDLYSRDLTIN